ncbi:ABC transporter permease subunit [Streptomyces sp. NPDC047022]|uniref:ABC transporter permease n=1 Tax=Streptomyces sp. NPDC047022 TaxID=3155737 RepID=UPI0033DDD439
MSFWEYLASCHHQLLMDAFRHAGVVFQCTACAAVLGVLIAVVACRSDRAGRLAAATTGGFRTVPALAVIGLLVPVVGLGAAPTVAALTLCGLLPVVRSSIVGLRTVGMPRADMANTARGGLPHPVRLVRVELPEAWPSILTGMRTSTRLLMGVAAIAACASGPGLGNEIFRGLGAPGSKNALNEVLAGTLGIVVLSLLFDAAYLLLGRLTLSGRPSVPAQPEERPT